MRRLKALLSDYALSIAITFISLLCFWAILSIDMDIIPKIVIPASEKFVLNLNKVMCNLSYSYIAGLVCYILTVYAPFAQRRRNVMPEIRKRVQVIQTCIEKILMEFSRGTNFNPKDLSKNNCINILTSKNWSDIIPKKQNDTFMDKSYDSFIGWEGISINSINMETISLYKDFLSPKQIMLLEHIADAKIFKMVDSSRCPCHEPVVYKNEDIERFSLIFYEMVVNYKALAKTVNLY